MLDYHALYPMEPVFPAVVPLPAVDPVIIPVLPVDDTSHQVNGVHQKLARKVSVDGDSGDLADGVGTIGVA